MDLSNIFCLFIVIILVKARKINSEPVEIDPKVSSKQTKNQFRPSDILLSFTFREENVILELKLNEHLLPENHFLSYQKPNGAKVLQISSETTKELCHYQVSMINGNFFIKNKPDRNFTHSGKCTR